MFDVVCFGSAVVDNFIDTDISKNKNLISYPIGSKILIKNLKTDIGGGGTNTATGFSRFGFKTGCICGIGNDNNGKEILDLLKKEKIKFLGKTKNHKSGTSIILDSKDKSRTILTYKGVNDYIQLKDLKNFKTRYLYLTSLLGKSFETQKSLAKKLKKQGTKIILNPSEYLIKRKNLRDLLKITDILILNKDEAGLLTKDKDLINGLHKLGPGIIVITDKNNPIICSNKKNRFKLKPHKIKVVERTGAGDAFGTGFVAGIILGKSILDSLKLGLKESESVIKYFGAKNNLLKINLKNEK